MEGIPNRFRPADSVYVRVFDGELVVLDLSRGEYFALNDVGAALWTGVERGKTLEEIADRVVEDYEVTRDKAMADLSELCNDLYARGLFVERR